MNDRLDTDHQPFWPVAEKPEAAPKLPPVTVEYTNWLGKTSTRTIIPVSIWYGQTKWHPVDQWMLKAWDVEKEAMRDFAWKDMKPI